MFFDSGALLYWNFGNIYQDLVNHLEDIADAHYSHFFNVRGLILLQMYFQSHSCLAAEHICKSQLQKTKRGKKAGSKQGRKGARVGKKQTYVKKIRSLRYLLGVAKDRGELPNEEFWKLYKMTRGNTVRNKAHLRSLMAEVLVKKS